MKDSVMLAGLVQRARDRSLPLQEQHRAFGELVRHTEQLVFGLALAALRDADDAEDAAQDTFTAAWHRLHQLRDPRAFTAWLRAIVARACARKRRPRTVTERDPELPSAVEPADRTDYASFVGSAVQRLPKGEQDVTILFYYLGYTQRQIASRLRLKPGTVGKRLHSARLRIRRGLPRSVRADFVRLVPSKEFLERVGRGLLDEYVGRYRFETRPELVVTIRREGDSLVSEANGQRHVLVSVGRQSLLTVNYDGEGRFRRDRRGVVTDLVYYEFGRRMGVARKMTA